MLDGLALRPEGIDRREWQLCEMMLFDNIHRIPDCLACFMGPIEGERTTYCSHCDSESGHDPEILQKSMKHCKVKYHEGFGSIRQNYGKSECAHHDMNWCTVRLVRTVDNVEA